MEPYEGKISLPPSELWASGRRATFFTTKAERLNLKKRLEARRQKFDLFELKLKEYLQPLDSLEVSEDTKDFVFLARQIGMTNYQDFQVLPIRTRREIFKMINDEYVEKGAINSTEVAILHVLSKIFKK